MQTFIKVKFKNKVKLKVKVKVWYKGKVKAQVKVLRKVLGDIKVNWKTFTSFCRTMSKHMAPQNYKVNIHPSTSTPTHIALLSPGIDGSYCL